ncbi:MAG: T9SS type A sorting domain-containing protein [Bacteroidia bacterium]|nr:T9SS type A sorting domain-containing protein [Bacteroidia bacterium]
MKKIILVFACLFFLSYSSKSQNLVPNGGFEQFINCPSITGEINSAVSWFNPTIGGYQGSPDYFHTCTTTPSIDIPTNFYGYQQAHGGNAYAGILLYFSNPPNSREFLEVPLTNVLLQGESYQFEMYVNLVNAARFTTDDIQVYFSDTAVMNYPTYSPLPFVPQISNTAGNDLDTASWTLVSGSFIAQGGEAYLIIGNFKDDAATSTSLSNQMGTPYAYCLIDDVSLSGLVGNNDVAEYSISVGPNPCSNQLNVNVNKDEPIEIMLFDMESRIILQQSFTSILQLNTETLATGMYMYQIKNNKGIIKQGKLVKE